MSKSAYVFIDGNNFYHNVKKITKPGNIDYAKLSEFVCAFFDCKHIRSIYYNSVPSTDDGELMYHKHMKFLSDITKLPKFEVKTRKLQRHSTKEILLEKRATIDDMDFCKNCQQLVETMCFDCVGSVKKKEKGIDVMIAIDMLDKCLIEKECDFCILVSGDADFIHALDIIKKNEKDVATAFIPKGYSYELRRHHKHFIIGREALIDNCLKDYKTIIA